MKFLVFGLLLFFVLIPLRVNAAQNLDLSKAVVVGNGPKVIIEFTDPDCSFCRKASAYFDTRSDIKRYIFFYPLPNHPNSISKIRHILSRNDKVRAYHNVMFGSLDRNAKYEFNSKGVRLQEEHLDIAKMHKIDSTPTFLVSGRIIEGFDLKQIEELIGLK
ncbi:MAG: hypothetical protein A2079_01205 [Geobacteraceae bacterium GWC2_48_7]|nr:MAG: hypothetical protein A2079_01205 [Geobacteraceae bacterium GWC2_48_7]